MTMPTPASHLSEAERQALADGSLAADRVDGASAHLTQCADCSADVARLTALMTRIRQMPAAAGDTDDLWPDIRSRIEQSKVIRLEPADLDARGGARTFSSRTGAVVGTAAAAALLFVAAMYARRDQSGVTTAATVDTASFINVADSSHAYEEEARALMNDLEMRRSMLRPQTASSIDGDLRTINDAIAEAKDALAHDPNNSALRRLLASSYKQKVELLKRANNAG